MTMPAVTSRGDHAISPKVSRMRAALFACLAVLGIPAAAHADTPKLVVWHDTVLPKWPDNIQAATSVSHLLYLNNGIATGGFTVNPGGDDSRTNRSSIATSIRHLDAWSYGADEWNQLVQCVKETYAPFNVQITET